jgi:hypothetical protein
MNPSFSMRVVSAPDVIFQTVGDEAVILNLKTSLYLGLNPVGTRMWMTLTGAESIQEAFEALQMEYDVPADQLSRDLEEFLARLNEYALIGNPAETPAAPRPPENI